MIKRLVILSALAIGTASMAHADSINGSFSVLGNDNFTFNSTTGAGAVEFGPSFVSGAIGGSFLGLIQDGNPVIFSASTLPFKSGLNTPPPSLYPAGFVPIFSVTGATGEKFTFDMTSYSVIPGTCAGTCLAANVFGYISATGPVTFTDSGYAYGTTTLQITSTLPGDFPYTYSGQVTATPAVTPEPSSLALLGTGMLGVVGIARRKFAV